MAQIVPTITAENAHIYREQMERIEPFAERIHIDLMDGTFAPSRSLPLEQVWWSDHLTADIHIMFQEPQKELDHLIQLRPHLVVMHPESGGDIATLAPQLQEYGIKAGAALLADTPVEDVAELLPLLDHLLIFSGNLGYQGGSTADLALLSKVEEVKRFNPKLEIGWDGGVNDANVAQLVAAGVQVVNVGGYIHSAPDVALAYRQLTALLP